MDFFFEGVVAGMSLVLFRLAFQNSSDNGRTVMAFPQGRTNGVLIYLVFPGFLVIDWLGSQDPVALRSEEGDDGDMLASCC